MKKKLPNIFISESEYYKRHLRQITDRYREISEFYEDWSVRFYHNISDDDEIGNDFLCKLSCNFLQYDICDVNNIPQLGTKFIAPIALYICIRLLDIPRLV